MDFKSVAVSVGTGDTDVFEMPATLQGAVVLGIGNVNGSARTITLKFYNANLNTTTTIVSGYSIAANTAVKWPFPILMATGDKIIMSASNGSSIVAHASITDSASAPVATGLTARGNWSNAITYNANDLVWVDDAISTGRGASYIAKVNASPNINKDPTTETAFWMRYAGDGPPGDLSTDDIGVTVQGYDANTAKTNVAQTFSANQKIEATLSIQQVIEKSGTTAGAPSSTVNFNWLSGASHEFTSNAANNWTLNVRGDGSTTLNSLMAVGEQITIEVVTKQGSTGYRETAFNIDGTATGITQDWVGGAPSAANTNCRDTWQHTIKKTADATWYVRSQRIKYG